jgi:hypothetical protein
MRLVGWAGSREDVRVVDASVDSLRAELALLAARFVLSGVGPDVNRAIRVACDLLARDLDAPATVGVAALAYGTPLRDAGFVIRDMLREQGFPAAGPDAGEAEEFITVLRAVAAGGMETGGCHGWPTVLLTGHPRRSAPSGKSWSRSSASSGQRRCVSSRRLPSGRR